MTRKRLRSIRIAVLSLLFTGAGPFTLHADRTPATTEPYILIVNSYTEASALSYSILTSILEAVTPLHDNTEVSVEHMNLLLVRDEAALDSLQNAYRHKYTRKPRLIVYIDSPAWALLHGAFDERWPGVPSILYSEKNYVGSTDCYLNRRPIPQSERVPIHTLIQGQPIAFVHLPVYLQGTIDLIHDALPDFRELLFISDQRWASVENRAELERLVLESEPGLRVRFLTEGEYTFNEVLTLLREARPEQGIIFYSWYVLHQVMGSLMFETNLYRILSNYSPQPIFTVVASMMVDGNMAGGYFPASGEIQTLTNQALAALLVHGAAGPLFLEPTNAAPWINYPVALRTGVDLAGMPSGVHYYNRPPSFLAEHKYQLAGGVLVLTILLLIILLQWREKRAQELRMQHMRDYRNLFDNMPIGYLKLGLVETGQGRLQDYVLEQANPAFIRIFQGDGPKLGAHGTKIDRRIDESLRLLGQALAGRGIVVQYERSNRNYSVLISPSGIRGKLDVFYLDNTELAHAQQSLSTVNHKLALALEAARMVPWRLDIATGRLVYDVPGNQPGQSTGTARTILLSRYLSIIHAEDRSRVRHDIDDLAAGRTEHLRNVFRIVLPRHQRVEWIEVHAAIEERDAERKPRLLVGSLMVVTQRIRLEQDLLTAKEKAEESNRLKSAFLANMSHEIRTPLNAIIGFSGVLASAEDEEEKREYVSIIENNNTLLLQLINDILDLSKIESGIMEFVYSDVDLNRLVAELTRTLSVRVKPGVLLEVEETIPDGCIRTERNRLTQVLTNLITNATKFTDEGSIRVGYRHDGDMLLFWVADTGCGIPKEKQQAIFDRFVKLNHFAQGTGLGLAICQTIVEHDGGKIWVESEPGKGSCFRFTIPYWPAERKHEQAVEVPLTPVEKDKLTILIAEDHADNFRLFETILGKDYRIVHAWNGREAVDLFDTYHPHLVLMDIHMPVLNGYEATAEIRKRSADVPIIAVTAYAYATDEERIRHSGFDDYTAKPLNARRLREQIVELLKRRLIFI